MKWISFHFFLGLSHFVLISFEGKWYIKNKKNKKIKKTTKISLNEMNDLYEMNNIYGSIY